MAVARIFFNMIKSNHISIDDVPDKWHAMVQSLMDEKSSETDPTTIVENSSEE